MLQFISLVSSWYFCSISSSCFHRPRNEPWHLEKQEILSNISFFTFKLVQQYCNHMWKYDVILSWPKGTHTKARLLATLGGTVLCVRVADVSWCWEKHGCHRTGYSTPSSLTVRVCACPCVCMLQLPSFSSFYCIPYWATRRGSRLGPSLISQGLDTPFLSLSSSTWYFKKLSTDISFTTGRNRMILFPVWPRKYCQNGLPEPRMPLVL